MTDNNWCVYKHTNKVNGKSYIGITCKTTIIRWGTSGRRYLLRYNNGKFKQPAFAEAIQKYGWENFEHEIIYSNLTEQEAKEKEVELIRQYHTYIGDSQCNGYNMTLGGEGITKYTTKARAEAALKEWRKVYYRKPDVHEKYLVQQKLTHKKRKADKEKHRKDLNCSLTSKAKAKAIRDELKKLYTNQPELFTEEDIQISFGKKQTTHSHKNYCCNSIKKLQQVLDKVKQEKIDNERSNINIS